MYDTANPTTLRPPNFPADNLPASDTQSFVTITADAEPVTFALVVAAGLVSLVRKARPMARPQPIPSG